MSFDGILKVNVGSVPLEARITAVLDTTSSRSTAIYNDQGSRTRSTSISASITHDGGWSPFTTGFFKDRLVTPAFSGSFSSTPELASVKANISYPYGLTLLAGVIDFDPGKSL